VEFKATDIGSEDNGELISFGFYNHEITYGLGFSRFNSEARIELMVADQSVYDLGKAEIIFKKDAFELTLPSGSIKEIDGDDYYKITYDLIDDINYNVYLNHLKAILSVNKHVSLSHS
jgi:hypothetical protein